ncbi:mechanosensitive ion channel family protein [Endozoicomonas sp. SCSIO W0465]|uniref:mechanosensitive ion channel family protein n=1 Tax=Endozoicomonas sp. SCSIO W0465 TaxID=2918516 RepID=UPI002075A187|nr:mechanosensitive ion channel domain-containing protein [Endozoicomonas sp. SCSIO W0465]USE39313.1 mechanosensitive ion channel family protein [Endozoicomonas sp. SCSIO W0465]
MNPELISFYSHLIIAFCLAAAAFYGIKWLADSELNGQKWVFWSLASRILRRPLLTLPWVMFVLYSAHYWPGIEWSGINETLLLFQKLILTIYPAWLIWEISLNVDRVLDAMGGRWRKRLSPSVIARSVQLIIVVATFLSIAQVFGYSLSTLLAFGGIGGIILGLAAKDWLANFFGGLMLMLDRPFTEGDWIRSPDRSIEGHVEKVGWRLTKIRTFDRRPIYVPNSIFTGIVVENATRMRNRRMIEHFSLRYEDIGKMSRILSRIDDLIQQIPEVDNREPHYAVFIRYDDSALLCQVRVHITRTDRVGFLKAQESILLLVAAVVDEEGASFAYPTRRILSDGSIT